MFWQNQNWDFDCDSGEISINIKRGVITLSGPGGEHAGQQHPRPRPGKSAMEEGCLSIMGTSHGIHELRLAVVIGPGFSYRPWITRFCATQWNRAGLWTLQPAQTSTKKYMINETNSYLDAAIR